MSNKQFIKLKFIAESFSSSIKQSDVQENADYPVYGASGHVGYLDTYGYDKRYIGIVKDGAGVGRTGIYEGFSSLLATLSYIIPRDETNTSLEYLKYSIDALNLEESYGEKATIPHIYFSVYGNYKILNIPHIEQKKLASYLDDKTKKIEQLISNQQQQIEKLKEYKQSLISDVVTKGLDPNVEFKDSGVEWIDKIPEMWNLSRIKDLLSIPLFYGSNKSGDIFKENYPRYIRITDIQDDNLSTDTSNMQSYLHDDYERYLVQENDILFARSGATSGKTYLVKRVDTNNVFAGYLINGRFDQNRVNPYFINYYTKSSIWDMWKNYIFIQTTIQNISAEKFNSFILSIPTLEDQNRIVDFLDTKINKLDQLITMKINKIEKLENYKKSLIYEYVTGKKEVS